jgi:hypothetical protein
MIVKSLRDFLRSTFTLAAVLLSTTLPGISNTETVAEPKQPQSILEDAGTSYAAFGDSDDHLYMVTTTKPVPRDPRDLAVGVPTYIWDFGPLDGVDNGDGTATIYTDMRARTMSPFRASRNSSAPTKSCIRRAL